MQGKARINALGALQHIMVRGIEGRYRFEAKGYDSDWVAPCVAKRFGLDEGPVTHPGRYPNTVEVGSVKSYWAAWEFGITTAGLSKRLGMSQPTASRPVKRGRFF